MVVSLDLVGPDGTLGSLVVVDRVEIGREPPAHVVGDPSVSRRHLGVEVRSDGVFVVDLGSSNGTVVDGRALVGEVQVVDGATVLFGDSSMTVRIAAPVSPVGGSPSAGSSATVVRPVGSVPEPELAVLRRDLVEVRFLPGSAGADVAPSMLDIARRARRSLAGLGSESWAKPVVIALVDPFPDPTDPARLVTSGSVISDDDNTIWMVVTPESPPEDPHRGMALLFGAVLPSAADVEHLLEGYGLRLGGAPNPSPEVIAGLPGAVEDLAAELRAAVAGSFVDYVIAREDEATFKQLIAAPAGRLSETWTRLYGMSAAALEQRWRNEKSTGEASADTRQFLKLSWHYLRPYRLRQIEVFGFMLFSLAFSITYPFVTKRLFDKALPSGEFSQVLTLLLILGGAFGISMLAGLRQNYQNAWISGSVVRDLRQEIFARVQRLPDQWMSRHSQGDVLSRMMNDVGRVEGGLTEVISGGIFQVASLIVSTLIMFRVSVVLGIVVAVGAPIVAVIYRLMSKGAQRRSLAVQEDMSALMGVGAENYQANPVVKLFRLGKHEDQRFARSADRLFRSHMRLSLFGGLFGLSVNGIVTLLRLIVLGLGAWLVTNGRFTLGGLVAFLGVMGEVLNPITGLTTLGQTVQASMGALVRIGEILDAPEEPEGKDLPPLAPIQSELTLSGVSLSYGAERRALSGIDVQIRAGSRVAFVGPSGSGKSSVLRVLMRLYDPDEGTVRLDGVDVATCSLESLRAQMGVVFQDSFLFNATVRENIALGKPGASEAEIIQAAKAAEVDSFVGSLARGYDTMVGEGGRNLSGGQRQRVAIARALIGNPRMLLLDEATSALDPKTERLICNTLQRVGSGRTVVAITHRLSSVADFDRIVMIVDGRVEETGTHDELVRLGGSYARQWAEQTGEAMPEAPPFDPAAALVRIPLFRNLDPEALHDVVSRLKERTIKAGDLEGEGGDQLLVIASGRAEVLAPTINGEQVVVRSVGPGEVFGMNALLGADSGSVLRAVDTVRLLVLDGEVLAGLTRRHPTIASARSGRSTVHAPVSGRRLTLTGTISGVDPAGRTGAKLPTLQGPQ